MVKFTKPLKIGLTDQNQGKGLDKHLAHRLENAGLSGAAWKDQVLSPDLPTNLQYIKKILNNCSDLIDREFVFAQNEQIRLALVYIDGLTDKRQVSEHIMKALSLEVPETLDGQQITQAQALEFIKRRGLCINQIKETGKLQDVIHAILSGNTVLLVDGHSTAIINGTSTFKLRAISEPEAEPTVRGPRESFVESLQVNISLIRRIIKSPMLKTETFSLGKVTNTDVVIIYLEGIVNDKLVAEVRSRLQKIKVDAVLESCYIEELIEDNSWSPFPTINHTERPDRVAAMLLEGRVAILIDGTPFVLTAPTLFIESIHTPEDHYERFMYSSAVRLVRFLSMILSFQLPSLYIAVVSFHSEMLPTSLLLSFAAQREMIPFPVFVEVFIIELAFEVLREAGIRLPRPVGQAVSIVGALVIGEAAVRAGLVAAITVIIVAFTGITSFVFSYNLSSSFRMLRFLLMILAATLGMFGFVCGIAVIGIHLCTLRSFGVPYLSPLAPTSTVDLKDTILRTPRWSMFSRPRLIASRNQQKEELDLKPAPPKIQLRFIGIGDGDARTR